MHASYPHLHPSYLHRMSDSIRQGLQRLAIPASLRARGRFLTIVPIFGFLLLVSLVFAPSSVSGSQLENLLYFGAILGFAALGQHLIITVGGLDLSVGPSMTLSALLFASNVGNGSASSTINAIVLGLLGAGAVGLVNGFTVTVLRVTPLIATLGGGAVGTGLAYTFVGQGAPAAVPEAMGHFIADTTLGIIPTVAFFWAGFAIAATLILRLTVFGRRFTAVGANPRTSRALGIPVDLYRGSAYVLGALLYGVGGIFLAIAVTTPGLGIGDSYLLPSISAVVIGGTALGGGLGSIGATFVGTLFVTQLNDFTLVVSGETAVQQIVQGAVILAAMAIYSAHIDFGRIFSRDSAKAPALPPEQPG